MPLAPDPRRSALVASSLDLIRSHQTDGGAYPAGPTFSAYDGYCWFRDGAFIADGASSAGAAASATAFFDWCAATMAANADRVGRIVAAERAGAPLPDERMLPARYRLDGADGTDEWWDFQLDGYGTWLWAAASHARRHGIDPGRWSAAAALTVDYLVATWRRPCYDWWEEHHEQVHVSTLGCIIAGLDAAVESGLVDGARAEAARDASSEVRALMLDAGVVDGHLVKWLGSDAVDASLLALIAPLRVIDADSPIGAATLAAVERDLAVEGGVHRFRADVFYGGGQWPLLAAFLGLARAEAGDTEGAREQLEWIMSTASADGALPEQVDRHLLAPEERQGWIDRWGPVASPLLWSSAMFLRLDAELADADDGSGAERVEEPARLAAVAS